MPSALEELAAGIMGTKVEAAKKVGLKPTPAEAARQQRVETGAPFPYDQLDMIEGALREVIRHAEFVLNGLGMVREAAPGASAVEDAQKAAEKAADAAAAAREPEAPFDDRLAQLQAEAQAATFTQQTPGVAADPGSGWTCPQHGTYEEKLSRKGRTFRACSIEQCQEFERLA